jgi:hypothetical protein
MKAFLLPQTNEQLSPGTQRRLSPTWLIALVLIVLPTADSSATSASDFILLGRGSLSKQTPTDLQSALNHFNNALSVDPNNLEANFLKAVTLLVLEQGSAEFQQQLTSIGVTVSDPNLYNFEYQLPVDAKGRIKPADNVMSDSTAAYLNTKVSPLIDDALACLAKFGNNPTSRAFRIQLNSSETSLADVRIDYGDVLIFRALLKGVKAGLALANSYNLSAEYALIYRLFVFGNLTPQRVLAELPNLLKFSGSDQRSAAKGAIIAANADYQAGYAFTKSQRLPAGLVPYLFEFSEPAVADDFASELAIVVGNLAADSESYLYRSFYPGFLRGLTVDTAKLLSSATPLRDFAALQFNQGYPTRNSWPDDSFGGLLPEVFSRGVLLDEFDLIIGQLIDSDGDGLDDSWERGYGRYEVVRGQFISDWATWDAQARGGHLATFTTQAEWDWFVNRHWREVDGPLYIGLFSDGLQPANWTWATTEQGAFRHWAAGQPLDDGIQNSAVIDPDLTWRSLRIFQGYFWDPMTWMSIVDMPSDDIGYVLERGYPTDHTKADTDEDGFNDFVETKIKTDPNNPASFPTGPDMDGDGVNNHREAIDGTDPLDPSSVDPLSIGLIAHYPFSGDANDESGFGRHGSVFSASPDEDRFGLSNRSYSFDGSTSYIGTPTTVTQYSSAATFSAWVRIPSNSPLNQTAIVSQAKDLSVTGLRLGLLNGQAEGAVSNPYYYPGDWWASPTYSFLSPSTIADGQWHHVVLVSEGWGTRLYLDGQEVAASYIWVGGQASLQPVLIGKEFDSSSMPAPTPSNHFFGQIDDVRIYDRALSNLDVTDLFAEESAPLVDTDGDGLPDVVETSTGVFVSRNNTGTDPNKADTDSDGLSDGAESNSGIFAGPSDTGSDPNTADSNADGIGDGEAVSGGFDPSVNLGPSIAWLTGLIEAQPGRFNLMTSDAIMDLNVGSLMIQRVGTNAVLKMQIQTSSDISSQPFVDFGAPITNSIPMPGRKGFLRVRVSGSVPPLPPPTPAPSPPYIP